MAFPSAQLTAHTRELLDHHVQKAVLEKTLGSRAARAAPCGHRAATPFGDGVDGPGSVGMPTW